MFAGILLLGIVIALICIVIGIRAETASRHALRRRRPPGHSSQDASFSPPDLHAPVLFHAQATEAAHASEQRRAHAAHQTPHAVESTAHSASPSAQDCSCDTSSSGHDSGGSSSCDSGGGSSGGSCSSD